jgi:nucleoside 2-deoxyribosyltransferase
MATIKAKIALHAWPRRLQENKRNTSIVCRATTAEGWSLLLMTSGKSRTVNVGTALENALVDGLS